MAPSQNETSTCSVSDPLDLTHISYIARRETVKRRIRSLEDCIGALKSLRNELSPIFCLPAEILCYIFSFIILSRPGYPESWTNFSQVSQHWRSLALSAPELWTNIPLRYPRWAREMLIRSKMAKLTIRFDPYIEISKDIIETIRSCLNEMNRVEAIDITRGIQGLTLEEIFRDLPNMSAPQLHTLCIGSYYMPRFSGFPIGEDFLYDTECLRRVELTNCNISWDSRLLTGLTRLTLKDACSVESSINQMLHALQRMPALTELHLEDSIPDDSESPSTYPAVELPCLRQLSISSGVCALTTVLRHITIPNSANLDLTCKGTQANHIDFSNFLSVLSTKFLSYLDSRSFEIINETLTHGFESN